MKLVGFIHDFLGGSKPGWVCLFWWAEEGDSGCGDDGDLCGGDGDDEVDGSGGWW